MREAWTDERLDDLTHRVDLGFEDTKREFPAMRAEMREEFQAVRAEMRDEFQAVRAEMRDEFQAVRAEMREESQAVRTELKGEIGGVRSEIRELRAEMAATNRILLQVGAGGAVTMLVGFATVLAAILVPG